MKLALIGLGNMGEGVAQRLLAAGFELTVWNRSIGKTDAFVARGARRASTVREAAGQADAVVTCLMDDASILGAVEGPDGMLAGLRKGALHLCAMTISPGCADTLAALHAAHGSDYVSAPVVGRPDAAAAGSLVSYLAGPARARRAAAELAAAYSSQVVQLGDHPRQANCMKLAVNYSIAASIELMGEAYAFADKCGLSLQALREFFEQSWFMHPAARLYAGKLLSRDFTSRGGFVMRGGLKDVRLMLAAAGEAGVGLEIGAIVERKLALGVASGLGDADWSAFYEITRKEAGLD